MEVESWWRWLLARPWHFAVAVFFASLVAHEVAHWLMRILLNGHVGIILPASTQELRAYCGNARDIGDVEQVLISSAGPLVQYLVMGAVALKAPAGNKPYWIALGVTATAALAQWNGNRAGILAKKDGDLWHIVERLPFDIELGQYLVLGITGLFVGVYIALWSLSGGRQGKLTRIEIGGPLVLGLVLFFLVIWRLEPLAVSIVQRTLC